MANGYSAEQMLDRIEVHILRVEEKVDKINREGCALKPEHDRRLASLEDAKNKTVGAAIMSLLAAVGALAVAIVGHLSSK
jgi:hypothetical protein